MNQWFHWCGNEVKMIKSSEIKEIALNPIFNSIEDFENLENSGFNVRWMTDEEKDVRENFMIEI